MSTTQFDLDTKQIRKLRQARLDAVIDTMKLVHNRVKEEKGSDAEPGIMMTPVEMFLLIDELTRARELLVMEHNLRTGQAMKDIAEMHGRREKREGKQNDQDYQ